jgi:hypothetical protein
MVLTRFVPGFGFLAVTRPALFFTPSTVVDCMGMPDLARGLAGSTRRGLFQLFGFFLVFELDEVGYVEESIALQAEVDKGRLHAG